MIRTKWCAVPFTSRWFDAYSILRAEGSSSFASESDPRTDCPHSRNGFPQVETDRVVVVDQQLALITLPALFDSQPKGFGAFPSAIAAWADPPYLSTLHPSHPPANAAGRRLPPTRVVW